LDPSTFYWEYTDKSQVKTFIFDPAVYPAFSEPGKPLDYVGKMPIKI
jgi:hypothetical protein